jgi:hypothetical protein
MGCGSRSGRRIQAQFRSFVGSVDHQTKRNPSLGNGGGAHSRIGVAFESVKVKFAQAVIVEAELHRRRFPNLACGGSRVHST